DSGGLICELGAEWVGESHERVRSLCRDFNLPLQKHQFNDFLMQNGRVSRPGEWNFSAKANSAFDKLLQGFEKLTPAQQRMLDRKDWWTHLSDAGFTQPDLILRELADSTDFGE
ncbi:MAG TPA: FAD-dependent oxidoreductase, partial [Blastocatellia bacterium]|nr:FAD-dependent oxidoreductase [Blastocatellia bacterium]